MTQADTVELAEGFFTDPHELYRMLRREAPVTPVSTREGMRAWVVTRYEDARPALNDPRLSKDVSRFHEDGPIGFLDRHMLSSDRPDHTRLRKLVSRAFTVRAIARMRPRIEEIAQGLADRMAAKARRDGTVDLLDEFAFPLPMTVICELLGVPDGERDDFRGWSNTLLSEAPPDEHEAAVAAMSDFLSRLVAEKGAHPGDDMLSAIVKASEDGDTLSEGEAASMAFLLLVAGHETTVNLIGNGALALLRHPDQLAVLRGDPALVPNAVEEFLRYDGPVNMATFRYTTEPVEIGGTRIPEDQIVLVSLVSANRDPDRFGDPARLDVTRDVAGHVAFGHGIHHCLGAPLARLEGEIAFRTLLDRFPGLTLAGEPATLSWRHSTLIHGLTRLPVRVGIPMSNGTFVG
ncbi:cytochrome P450 family protein [Pseudonocardia kunmingensis]|uniref:Cytochrome P450 n=1 Tax=Pseudonocardia kunmingensis TaxID=630975 RepID=A0A543DKZ0_9PSEU|nr:cytochrome P450 [Pseudonocardia kunmingensis]TQM10010.1 cytochrome P450 [Pseudonocardia kunmingensis]